MQQLVEKDPDSAILWFWKAINGRDRVDSALKDMAVVMKQQDRAEEAVEAIRSFRHLCSKQAQESLDNLLIDLYKQNNYAAAEVVYRKAQMIEPDANKACNLGLCLMKQGRLEEARRALEDVTHGRFSGAGDGKSTKNKAEELLREIEVRPATSTSEVGLGVEDEIMERIELVLNEWVKGGQISNMDLGKLEVEISWYEGEDMMRHATLMAHGRGVRWRSVWTPPPRMMTSSSTWLPERMYFPTNVDLA
ncbi:hypothetical protein B296_00023226 [Ensete ventricosum]|uniref:Uncharacterized protein n=1 Tax=Ensete ventricosum TaxID=4639 RepID=A0A427A1P0_ENSVE|nr:hypothetical protein B296_00023226 [Ensete ventricosum]